jgi:hypothetical protein
VYTEGCKAQLRQQNGSIRGDTGKKTVLLEDDSALYPLKRKKIT